MGNAHFPKRNKSKIMESETFSIGVFTHRLNLVFKQIKNNSLNYSFYRI